MQFKYSSNKFTKHQPIQPLNQSNTTHSNCCGRKKASVKIIFNHPQNNHKQFSRTNKLLWETKLPPSHMQFHWTQFSETIAVFFFFRWTYSTFDLILDFRSNQSPYATILSNFHSFCLCLFNVPNIEFSHLLTERKKKTFHKIQWIINNEQWSWND